MARITQAGSAAPAQSSGFTYLGLLLIVAMMSGAAAVVAQVWHTTAQREKEAELLFYGTQIQQAIGRYYHDAPDGENRFPLRLEDLLQDNRSPAVKRHLRKMYPDPMTQAEWGLIRAEDGGIQGVYSLSTERPFKTAGFDEAHADFENKLRYQDWKFLYLPTQNETAEDGEGSAEETRE